jgi:hypothetical protein
MCILKCERPCVQGFRQGHTGTQSNLSEAGRHAYACTHVCACTRVCEHAHICQFLVCGRYWPGHGNRWTRSRQRSLRVLESLGCHRRNRGHRNPLLKRLLLVPKLNATRKVACEVQHDAWNATCKMCQLSVYDCTLSISSLFFSARCFSLARSPIVVTPRVFKSSGGRIKSAWTLSLSSNRKREVLCMDVIVVGVQ